MTDVSEVAAQIINRCTRPVYAIGEEPAVMVSLAMMQKLQRAIEEQAAEVQSQAIKLATQRAWTR